MSGRHHVTSVIKLIAGQLGMSCVTLLSQDSWEIITGFLWSWPSCLFPLLIFVFFSVINHGHEYDYMLSSVILPGKHEPGGDRGDPYISMC